MKTIKNLLLSFLLLMVAVPAMAQTATTRTALSTALTNNSNQVVVLSATGISASTGSSTTFIAICDGNGLGTVQACEQMQVRSISGTTLTVTRGIRGNPTAHPANSIVWYGTAGNFIGSTGNTSGVFVPATPSGTCTRTSNQFLPVLNPNTGDVADCILSLANTTDRWQVVNAGQQFANFFPLKRLPYGTSGSSAAYTALLSDTIIGVNTSTALTITLPACTGCEGKWYHVIDMNGGIANAPTTITISGSAGQPVNSGATASLVPSAVRNQGNWIFFDGSSNSWYIPVVKNALP